MKITRRLLAISALVVISVQTAAQTHNITGTGTLTGVDSSLLDSTYVFSGNADVNLVSELITFSYNQEINNAAGDAIVSISGGFSTVSGNGMQIVSACTGQSLICDEITALVAVQTDYTVSNLDITHPDNITWDRLLVEATVLGDANSSANYAAAVIPVEPATPPSADPGPAGCVYNPTASYDMLIMILLACGIFYVRISL